MKRKLSLKPDKNFKGVKLHKNFKGVKPTRNFKMAGQHQGVKSTGVKKNKNFKMLKNQNYKITQALKMPHRVFGGLE